MAQTDNRIEWPKEIKWKSKKILDTKGLEYVYEEFLEGPLYLAYYPAPHTLGSYLRVELAWGPGSTFQHTLVTMQLQAQWNRAEFANRARDALVGLGLVKLPETPDHGPVDPRD